MRPFWPCALVAVLAATACNEATPSGWEHLADVSYVMPSHLPSGWTVAYATERPGRPVDDWDARGEVYVNDDRDEFVVVNAQRVRRGKATRPSPPRRNTYEPGFGLAAVLPDLAVDNILDLKSLQSSWRTSTLRFVVIHFAARPSKDVVARVAAKFERFDDLDFAPPSSAAGDFARAGSTGGEVTDYTMVFTPKRFAGTTRAQATKLTDDAPSIGINVGAHFYAQRADLPELDDAKVERDGDDLRLEYVHGGSSVSIQSDAVSREELLAVARSLEDHSQRAWRKQLGKRLLTQDPPD